MRPEDQEAPLSRPPRSRKLRLRHARVLVFFGRAFLSVLLWDLILRRVGFKSLSRRTASGRYRRTASQFRSLATELGGLWIKVGQFLSARVDVLPQVVTDELAGLQDEVAPEPFEALDAVVVQEFGVPTDSLFDWHDPQPLASASLGQVHRARLSTGESVVLKIQRPHIHDLLRVDMTALTTVIGWLKRYRPIARRADLDALVEEFSRTLWEEVDYLAEADHARRFASIFADDPGVRIPQVFPSYTTARVLTLEDVYFIKITDYSDITAAGVDRQEVADRLFSTYLHQIFELGFFHADPHPGNLFVEPPQTDGQWRLIFVDFGMVGRLAPTAKSGLRDLAIAIGTRDIDRLVQSYEKLGVLLPGADLERIRQAEAAMLQRLWGKSMRELVSMHPKEMREFAHEFRDLIYEMPFQVPTDLVFLGRCVAILSGMCTGLNPEFNLFEGLAPFARQLLAEEKGDWVDLVIDWLVEQGSALVSLPSRMDSLLTQLEQGRLTLTMRPSTELEASLRVLNRSIGRMAAAVVFATFLMAGTLFYTRGDHLLGGIGLALAFLALVWVVRK